MVRLFIVEQLHGAVFSLASSHLVSVTQDLLCDVPGIHLTLRLAQFAGVLIVGSVAPSVCATVLKLKHYLEVLVFLLLLDRVWVQEVSVKRQGLKLVALTIYEGCIDSKAADHAVVASFTPVH